MADNINVKTKTELLKTHKAEQVKQHTVLDALGRAKFIFTAPIDAINGTPCECTEYVYLSPTSTLMIGRQERVYTWKSAWDAIFTFDPTANYDPDGDGVL